MSSILHIPFALLFLTVFGCSKKPSGHVNVMGSRSMEPTIKSTDHVAWDEISISDPIKRGDIVVILSPIDGSSKWVQRVIGLEGEFIELNSSGVLIDEKEMGWVDLLPQPPNEDIKGSFSVKIPLGYFYCVGDNLNNSRDSREFGPIERKKIIGRVNSWGP